MIKSIKITNFCSIGETQEISFQISPNEVLDQSAVKMGKDNINLVNCFIGHNASGKTTVLKAISFILWWMRNSYTLVNSDEPIPVEAHKLHEEELTKIEIEFFNKKISFQYGIELNKYGIHREFLGEHIKRDYTRVFEYTRQENSWDFKSPIAINKNDLRRFKERKNATVLSSLIETGYLPQLSFIKNYVTNLSNIGHFLPDPITTFFAVSKFFDTHKEFMAETLNFTKDADLGIADFQTYEYETKNGVKIDESKKVILACLHESSKGNFVLPLINESNGTQHQVKFLADILPILETGGVVILDEIDAGLHPHLTKKIISLFENQDTNPHNAQLIFSTHQHLLINDRTKTQIFIVEKLKENLETEVFRLDDVEGVRNDENYFNKYLAGTYGGIPTIKWIAS